MIVDVFLAQGSGLGVLKAAREHEKPTKLVVLSNYATTDMRRKCIELGADRVFDKSNEIDALMSNGVVKGSRLKDVAVTQPAE